MDRNGIRMSILECVPAGMLLIPYAVIKCAGEYHLLAFVAGIILVLLYAWAIYGYTKLFHVNESDSATTGFGIIDACMETRQSGGVVISIIYIVRFFLKAGAISYVVGQLAKKTGIGFWWSVVIFVIVAVYGAKGSMRKKKTLAGVIFWWTFIPLILLIVFSISRMDFAGEWTGFALQEINLRTYAVAVIFVPVLLSGIELNIFSNTSLSRKDRYRQDYIRTIVWIVIAVAGAYIYAIGMMGRDYISKSSFTNLSFGTTFDYVLSIAWLVGALYSVSSYIFYANEFLQELTLNSEDVEDERKYRQQLLKLLCFTAVLFFCCMMDYSQTEGFLIRYLLFADLLISLIVPMILYVVRRRRDAKR